MGNEHSDEVRRAQNDISQFTSAVSTANDIDEQLSKLSNDIYSLVAKLNASDSQTKAKTLQSTDYHAIKRQVTQTFAKLENRAKQIPFFTGGLKVITDQVQKTGAIADLGTMGFKETGHDQRGISELARNGKISISNIKANTTGKGIQVTLNIENRTSNKIWFNVPQGAVMEQENRTGNQNVATTHKFNGSIPAYSSKTFKLPGFCINEGFGAPSDDNMACTILESLAVLKCFDENAFDKAVADLSFNGDAQTRVWAAIKEFKANAKRLANQGY